MESSEGAIPWCPLLNRMELIDQISAQGTSVCEHFAGHNGEEHPRIIIQRPTLNLEWDFGFISAKVVRPGYILKLQQSLLEKDYFIEMKNTVNIKQNDSLSNDLNESNLRDDRNEISPILTFENDSDLSILNSSYQIPDIPKKYIEPIILDTSLPYVSIIL